MVDETLVAVLRPAEDAWRQALLHANRGLPEHKRVSHVLTWQQEFPRTASMKVKRQVLADTLRERATREALLAL